MRAIWISSLLLGALAACQGKPADPVATAQEWCKKHYSEYYYWVSGRGEQPVTPEQIKQAAKLGDKDPWGHPYYFERKGRAYVCSAGPDGIRDTDDDIYYPNN